jgi:hypothetical protein
MAVGIVEIKSASVIPVVDFLGLLAKRVGPIVKAARPDACKDIVELRLADEKRKMPLRNRIVGVEKVQ